MKKEIQLNEPVSNEVSAIVEQSIIKGQKKLQKAKKNARKHINSEVADEFDSAARNKSRLLKISPEKRIEARLSARKKLFESLKKLLNPFKKKD